MSVVQAAVEVAAALLHCKVNDLVAALSTRRIRAGGDDIVQRLTYAQVWFLLLASLSICCQPVKVGLYVGCLQLVCINPLL